MGTLTLLLLAHVEPRPGAPAAELDRDLEERVGPLLAEIAARPDLRVSVHLAGELLERGIATSSPALATLRDLVRRGQVEAIGGAWHEAVLSAIPEVDATGQVQYTAGVLREQVGVAPAGAWPALLCWDPALPRLLHAAGARYTFADSARFVAAGIAEEEALGYYTAERLGCVLAVFPIHGPATRILAADPPWQVPEALCRLVEGRARAALTALLPVAGPWDRDRLGTVLDALVAEMHRVPTGTFSDYLEDAPPRGTVALPAGLPDPSTRLTLGVAMAERYAEVMAALEAADVREIVWPWLARDPFEGFLARYPEANLLHKRMLRVSQRVDRLRRAVREALRRDPIAAARSHEALARACARMWRGQAHGPYWHGEHAGVYDRELRHRAWGDLLAAERTVDEALGETQADTSIGLLDVDGDGRREVVAETSLLRGVWSPRDGGALLVLELRPECATLLPVVRRHEEPYHARLAWSGVQLIDPEDPISSDLALEAPHELEPDPIEERIAVDPFPRGAFHDHFLGAETTPAGFARRQYREVGDFVAAPYEVIQNGGGAAVVLGRSGVADEGDRRALLRVEKAFAFEASARALAVRYRLINRSFEPTRFWWGVELNLDPPGPRPEEREIAVIAGSREIRRTAGAPFEREGAGEVRLQAGAFGVRLTLGEPLDLWYHPVATVTRTRAGLELLHQGACLLLHGRFALWGGEETQVDLRLEILSEGVEPEG